MNEVFLKKVNNLVFTIILCVITNNANASIIPDIVIPDREVLELLETGPSWLPKPYKTPIEQGVLIENENLQKLTPGLDKQQVKFLLGTPTIIDTFHTERWDYIYYERNDGEFSKPKRVTVLFKNEKVSEIYDQHRLIKRMGEDLVNTYEDAPIRKQDLNQNNIYKEIIIAKRDDYLTATLKNKLPVCIDDEFESYLTQKTLFDADEETLEVRSDVQNQDEQGIFYAEGNVELERADDLLKADKAQFNADTGVLAAEGNVKYLTEDLSLYASKGGYNSEADTVNFSGTTYNFPTQDRPGRGAAEEIFIDNSGTIYLTPSSYTTCGLDDPDWEITSSETILYRDIDRGHSYNIFLKYKDVPVLYSPFFSFPLSKNRHSGFLFPTIGSSGESGTIISTPYYFNIAENMDLTFTPTSYSGRGQMFEAEVRYKTKNSNTEFEIANMDLDDVTGKNRHAFFFRDNRTFVNTLELKNNGNWEGTRITTNTNVGGISDLTYFNDFGNTVSRVGRTHIKRIAEINRIDYSSFGYLNSSIRATDYQLAKIDLVEQYSVLPQVKIQFNTYEKNEELQYKFDGGASVFKHTYDHKTDGTRISLYPSVEYPIKRPGWELRSKVGVNHRSYSLSKSDTSSVSQTTPVISLRGKMIFDRLTGKNLLQTLEPEMYFLYIPASNQDSIPIFDSGENDLKYTLFSENKFYGGDRLNDAKQITLALSSSMIDTNSGNEILRATIGQIFYLDDRSVNLTNSNTDHSSSSNIMGLVNAKFADYWRLSGYTEFNPHQGYGEKNQIRLSYKRPYGKQNQIFNTSYRFSRGTQEEVDLSAVIPFNNRLSLVGKVNYSFNNRRSNAEDTLEKMIGVEYESCCYGIKFVLRDYWNGTKTDKAFYFEFLPKGIATSTNKTAELLRDGIIGYQDKFDY
ncbi:MAG: LPS assembly protein LptD [Gammaproteobacteria bacterium]|nr:LPS assembly protein LptD [Gammaproteobacteria bacterium]